MTTPRAPSEERPFEMSIGRQPGAAAPLHRQEVVLQMTCPPLELRIADCGLKTGYGQRAAVFCLPIRNPQLK
jgi:hypothetical protein